MEKEDIGLKLEKQRVFYAEGRTLDPDLRIENLRKLKSLIISHEREIIDALWKDFHKPECEVLSSEIQFVIKELNLAIRKLKSWTKPRRVRTPLVHFIAHSYISPQPYGQVLIFSPWNFPFQLSLVPTLGALAAGNCITLKVSQRVPATAQVIEKIISHLPEELIMVINGNHEISEYLLNQKYDYIFFTGSNKIGKQVMAKAAVNLTPVSLELGGKSPCVVTADARLDYAVKRIAWGKFYNAGQTCVAPDYILIDSRIKEKFLELISREINLFYGDHPEHSKDLPYVIDERSAARLADLMRSGQIVTGGVVDKGKRIVSPTIIININPDDPVMKEEIFGPVLPVIDYKDFGEVYRIIERNPKPLSAYIFTRSKALARDFLAKVHCGSAAINDTVVQFATPYLPFGGVGPSGMGRYHGRKTFDTFSNIRGVMVKSNMVDLFLRYPPYTKLKENVFRWFMR